jgi:hypothetical protein
MGPKKTQVEDIKGIHLQHPSRRKGRGQEGKLKGKKKHLKEKPKRHDNVADDKTCHTTKKAPHLEHGISRWAPLLLPSSFFKKIWMTSFLAIQN